MLLKCLNVVETYFINYLLSDIYLLEKDKL